MACWNRALSSPRRPIGSELVMLVFRAAWDGGKMRVDRWGTEGKQSRRFANRGRLTVRNLQLRELLSAPESIDWWHLSGCSRRRDHIAAPIPYVIYDPCKHFRKLRDFLRQMSSGADAEFLANDTPGQARAFADQPIRAFAWYVSHRLGSTYAGTWQG